MARCGFGGVTVTAVQFGGVRPGVLLAVVVAVAAVSASAGCSSSPPVGTPGPVFTPTTQIAGAGVLGNKRQPDASCAREPAAVDPGPQTRRVDNADGVDPETVEVGADPQRIVVLAGDQLDALCALGLQSRIVAAALPDGSEEQPSYLGAVVHKLPGVGTRSAPDLTGIAALRPDLILGSQALTPQLYPQLAAIAPTVFTGPAGAAWANTLRGVGAATGRTDAADALVDGFDRKAAEAGGAHDATHFQASIVQFTADRLRVYGAANFPAEVARAFGVDRPPTQRFTDKPFIEIELGDGADYSAADGDIVYVSFAGPDARDRAEDVLDSAPWRRLSANRENRVFVVNNEVWQTGQGVVAARGVVDDLTWVNAPIN